MANIIGATAEAEWLVVWHRVHGREAPSLVRSLDDGVLRFLSIAETGVEVDDSPVSESMHLRPVTMAGADYPPARALELYRTWAEARGASPVVRRELGLPPARVPPTPVATPVATPVPQSPPGALRGPGDALSDLYERAARLLEVPVDTLRGSLAHCNRGMQAMQLRSRLRKAGWQA